MIGSDAGRSFVSDPSAGLVRGWVGLYTRGLPAEILEARRDEIEADLWDEAEEAGFVGRSTASLRWQRLTRLAFGAPADLAWRLELGRTSRGEGSRRMDLSRRDLVWSLLGAGLSLLILWGGTAASGPDGWTLGRQYGFIVSAAGVLCLIASLITLAMPTIGGWLTVASAVAMIVAVALAMPWAWFVVLPVSIPLAYVGVRRLRAPRPATV